MTAGRPGPPKPVRRLGGGFAEPTDITAVRRSCEIFDTLSARRSMRGDNDDLAIQLLGSLVADVDEGLSRQLPRHPGGKRSRRGARAFVALGVTAAMLAGTGAAAASGVVPRVVPGASVPDNADAPFGSSKAELKRAEEAMSKGQLGSAREALSRARRGRAALHGSRASAVDREIGRLESAIAAAQKRNLGAAPKTHPGDTRPDPPSWPGLQNPPDRVKPPQSAKRPQERFKRTERAEIRKKVRQLVRKHRAKRHTWPESHQRWSRGFAR